MAAPAWTDPPLELGAPVLAVRDLVVEFDTREGVVHAVNGVSFEIYPGETLAIVGESGSGKSVSVMSALGLIDQPPGRVLTGEVIMDGRDILRLSSRELRKVRSNDIAMVFQDPMTSLNPVLSVGKQIEEALRAHDPRMPKSAARARSIELLELVGVTDPAVRSGQYPHQYSGGMRQRAMIAMAIANEPRVLIADEPTTALDVTIQAQILETFKAAQQETNAATIMITHDLGLIADMADRVVVMYAGRVVETGDVMTIFGRPRHPYTLGLMSSVPRVDADLRRLAPIEGQPPSAITPPSGCAFHPRCRLYQDRDKCHETIPPLRESGAQHRSACHFHSEVPILRRKVEEELGLGLGGAADVSAGSSSTSRVATRPQGHGGEGRKQDELLRVEGLKKYFPIRSGFLQRTVGAVQAVDDVSFSLHAGETLGLVGESGCGKSTTGKTVMGLLRATAGRVIVKGQDITRFSRKRMRTVRRDMQIVFQDPYSSLDPRMTVREIIAEPLHIHGLYRGRGGRARVSELMELVGLNPEHGGRFAHEFSGGQRQRIGIARAIALNPDVLVLDEPVSSLDVSIQAQVINLLAELQRELGLAYLFIAHDLAVVRQISHRVAVMYLGKIVEIGDKNVVYGSPTHPYTQSLLSAVPSADPSRRNVRQRIVLTGDVPNPASPPAGCNFWTRCFKVDLEKCSVDEPELLDRFGHGHPSACHFAGVRERLT